MSVRVGARILALVLTASQAAALACVLSCAAPATQLSAHECHGAPVGGDQVSTNDSCPDHPAPVAILTKTFRDAQTQLPSNVVDALTWPPLQTRSGGFLPDPDTGPPFHPRPILGLRI